MSSQEAIFWARVTVVGVCMLFRKRNPRNVETEKVWEVRGLSRGRPGVGLGSGWTVLVTGMSTGRT